MFSSPFATLVLMWIIFAVVHSGLASGLATQSIGRRLGKYYRPLYSVGVLVVLLLLIHYHFVAIDTILWRPHWLLKILAALLILPGFVIIVISLWKHLLPYTGIAVLLEMETEQTFETGGLHAYVRHPLYTGVLLFVWGVFIGYPYMNNLVSAACYTVYMLIGMFFLERKLAAQYGDAYLRYRDSVPLIIGVKKRKTGSVL